MSGSRFLSLVVMPVVWVLVAALVAFGGAGLVATSTTLPTASHGADIHRAEPVFASDPTVEPALVAATSSLDGLTSALDDLSGSARDALALMTANDADRLQTAMTTGTVALATVQERARSLDAAVAAVPFTGSDWQLHMTSEQHGRYEALASTAGLTDGLADAWATFTAGALDAVTVTGLLVRHDRETAAAAAEGTAAHYKAAIRLLDVPDATIAEARALQDQLASHTDISTLRAWIDANQAYDQALRALYTALSKSGGRVTKAVHAGLDAEQSARAGLPKDTGGLVVILSDIAQGGLNQAVISIEEARGAASAALDDATPPESPTTAPKPVSDESPGADPAASPAASG